MVDAAANEAPSARPECDLIMKGGVASGVIYPRAISKLAETHEFRSIGGTSAGAIAAAVTAAAAYGRRHGHDGFPALAEIPEWLGQRSGWPARTRLLNLFRPHPQLRVVLGILLSFLGRPALAAIPLAFLKAFLWQPILGAAAFIAGMAIGLSPVLLGAYGPWLEALGGLRWFAWIVPLLLGLLTAAVALTFGLYRRLKSWLPRNGYGLCSGMGKVMAGTPPLTQWLADLIDAAAGRLPANVVTDDNAEASHRTLRPLTMRDLWAQRIELEMMTTNLTEVRSHRFPYIAFGRRPRLEQIIEERRKRRRAAAGEARDPLEDFEGGEPYAFDPDEFYALFPRRVVDWMIDPKNGDASRRGERRLVPLPDPGDLPVVFGARLSLSFPVLLSAIPLYTVDTTEPRGGDGDQGSDDWRLPERVWFSDGGITSNFPIHFFDAALPSRPTFGINLTPEHPVVPDPGGFWLPWTNSDRGPERWNRFDRDLEKLDRARPNIVGFIHAVFNAAQNSSDNEQMQIPGYADRIVHVSLKPEEGGLNLDMPAALIDKLAERGEHALESLARRFAPEGAGAGTISEADAVLTWTNHRWVRFRSYMYALEKRLREISKRYEDQPPPTYAQLNAGAWQPASKAPPPHGYRWGTKRQRDAAVKATKALLRALADWSDLHQGVTFDRPNKSGNGAPWPAPELRMVPSVAPSLPPESKTGGDGPPGKPPAG